jgi:FkbM family methyltransferase
MEIACQTATEARFLYRDIFEKEIYCRHGISLSEAEVVFDVGANIGLFSLFVSQRCPQARIYAFEPAPPLFEILQKNVKRCGATVELFNCGLAAAAATAELTFYPSSSAMSSFHADLEEEKQALRTVMVNQLRGGEPGMEEVMKHADDLLDERLRSSTFVCPLRPLSDIIREHAIQRIDLLKIDVQKCELEVIQGIDDEHWPLIRQIVLELHNTEGQYRGLRKTLEEHGFHVFAEQETAYEHSVMLNVFASRARQDVVTPSRAPGLVTGRSALGDAQRRDVQRRDAQRRDAQSRDAQSRSEKMKSVRRPQRRIPSGRR